MLPRLAFLKGNKLTKIMEITTIISTFIKKPILKTRVTQMDCLKFRNCTGLQKWKKKKETMDLLPGF
jgi:hypothetical protein